MPTIEQIAKKQRQFLVTKAEQDRDNLLAAIESLEQRILALARQRLETDDTEKLKGPKVNLKMAQKLHEDLVREFKKKYGEAVDSTMDGYAGIAAMIRDTWGELGTTIRYTGIDRDMMDSLRTNYYDEFTRFGADAQQKMARAMYDAVAGQSGFQVLEAAISAALTGKLSKNGRPMSTYAKTFAQDATMNFHNAVTLKKAADAGIDQFLYYGNLMLTSRPFCIERAGKKFTREQIDSWTFKWQGKSGPAMTHRGGYNCRHHWMPVHPDWDQAPTKKEKPMTSIGRMGNCVIGKQAQAAVAPKLPITVASPVSDSFKAKVQSVVDRMPPKVVDAISKSGNQIVLSERLTDSMPHLKGVVPRGWVGDDTWDCAEGLYDESRKRVVLSETSKAIGRDEFVISPRHRYTVSHECGHALDKSVAGYYSQDDDFIDAWQEDIANMPSVPKKWLNYFTINVDDHSARVESFAEAFAAIMNEGTAAEPGTIYETFARRFPNVVKHVRENFFT